MIAALHAEAVAISLVARKSSPAAGNVGVHSGECGVGLMLGEASALYDRLPRQLYHFHQHGFARIDHLIQRDP